jgi:hypothetical protein
MIRRDDVPSLCKKVGSEVLNHLFRIERFLTQMSRTIVLASPASGAGLKIEQLLPGEFLDLRDAVGFRLFEIGDWPYGPLRFQGSIKNIESGEIDVLEGGTAHNNIAKESDRGNGVDQDPVPDEKFV